MVAVIFCVMAIVTGIVRPALFCRDRRRFARSTTGWDLAGLLGWSAVCAYAAHVLVILLVRR